MDPGTRLRTEFAASQANEMRKARARQRRIRFNAGVVGGISALAAVAITATVTRETTEWHSFVLEAVLGTVAGYLLARRGGGILAGAVYFCLAYLLAFQLRTSGFDPGVLFSEYDMRLAMAGQGHLLSLGILIVCGGAIGHAIES
jgi:hypothetical protein